LYLPVFPPQEEGVGLLMAPGVEVGVLTIPLGVMEEGHPFLGVEVVILRLQVNMMRL